MLRMDCWWEGVGVVICIRKYKVRNVRWTGRLLEEVEAEKMDILELFRKCHPGDAGLDRVEGR